MTLPLVTHQRPWVPVVNMLVAAVALVISMIALASAPTQTALIPPTPADDVISRDPTSAPQAIDGCTHLRGFYPC